MSLGHGDLAKAALLTEQEQAQSVVISNPTLSDNPLIFVSDEFEQQMGYAPEEVLGRNCRFLQGPETDPVDYPSAGIDNLTMAEPVFACNP